MVKLTKTIDLRWLLDDFVQRVAAADRVVVLSADGLLVGQGPVLNPRALRGGATVPPTGFRDRGIGS